MAQQENPPQPSDHSVIMNDIWIQEEAPEFVTYIQAQATVNSKNLPRRTKPETGTYRNDLDVSASRRNSLLIKVQARDNEQLIQEIKL